MPSKSFGALWTILLAASMCLSLVSRSSAQCGTACAPGSNCASTNGDFESGTFSGWTQTGSTAATYVAVAGFDAVNPHGGMYMGAFGPSAAGGVSQIISARIGDEVTISFWYQALGATNSFLAVFDSQTLVTYTNDTAHTAWTQYTFRAIATTNNPTLAFTFTNPPDYDFLDDVSACVTPNCSGVCAGSASCGGVNGAFETGTFAGWAQFGNTGFTSVEQVASAHGGAFDASFGPLASGGISQTIAANAGDEVTINFWYKASGNNNYFSAEFDNHTLTEFTNDTAHTAWTHFTYIVKTSTTNPSLVFTFFNPPDFTFLDDVSACVSPNCGAACPAGSSCSSTNGTFETGDLTAWSQFGDTGFTGVDTVGGDIPPHGGTYHAIFGPTSPGGISQIIPAHVGDTVTIGFWYAAFSNQNSFSAAFDGNTLVSYTNDTAHTAYTHLTYSVVSTSNNPSLVFTFTNPPDYDFLDDVTVCVTPSCSSTCPGGATCASANSGFEANSLTGWTQSGATDHIGVFTGPFGALFPHGGTHAAYFGPTGAIGTINQTIPANPGDAVTISFWYAALGANNSFSAVFNGQTLVSYTNDTAHTAWTQFSYSALATSANPTLSFNLYNPPDYDYLDDVSVCVTPGCGSICGGGSTCGSTNGSFETGTFAGWLQTGSTVSTSVIGGGGHTGGYFRVFGPTAVGGITQVVPAHIGDEVTITFWYDAFGATNTFSAVFDGQTLVSYTNDTTHTAWTEYTFPVVSTSNNPSLAFNFSNPPSFSYLDDVSACISTPGLCCRGAYLYHRRPPVRLHLHQPPSRAPFVPAQTACNTTGNAHSPCCYADYNKTGGISVQDIFDFINDWLASSPFANTGGTGATGALNVQNIFDFINDWLAGGC